MRFAEWTCHSHFVAKCQIDYVVSVSEPGVTSGNHSATEEHRVLLLAAVTVGHRCA